MVVPLIVLVRRWAIRMIILVSEALLIRCRPRRGSTHRIGNLLSPQEYLQWSLTLTSQFFFFVFQQKREIQYNWDQEVILKNANQLGCWWRRCTLLERIFLSHKNVSVADHTRNEDDDERNVIDAKKRVGKLYRWAIVLPEREVVQNPIINLIVEETNNAAVDYFNPLPRGNLNCSVKEEHCEPYWNRVTRSCEKNASGCSEKTCLNFSINSVQKRFLAGCTSFSDHLVNGNQSSC